MWTRSELKSKAKAAFKANYWKTVLIALFVIVLSGALYAGSSVSNARSPQDQQQTQQGTVVLNDDGTVTYSDGTMTVDDDGITTSDDVDVQVNADPEGGMSVTIDQGGVVTNINPIAIAMMAISFMIAFVVVLAISLAIEAFVVNPAIVGAQRFFLCNLNQPAYVREVGYGFDNNYRETVRTMFWRDIYTVLWCLLLIIPGIVKSYEYRMIPYLLADDPTMTKERAFAESKRMMNGNKWSAFVLDLSFIGWYILSVLTLGILAFFYVTPYKCMTDAALYERLRYGTPAVEAAAPVMPGLPSAQAPTQAPAQVPVPPFAQEVAPAPVATLPETPDAPEEPEAPEAPEPGEVLESGEADAADGVALEQPEA